jgi:hypothetical protein
MAITHAVNIRNQLADVAVDALDLGTTDATGDIVFTTAADVAVVSCTLSNPAFAGASGGQAVANAIAESGPATAGVVAKFEMRDRDNVMRWTGSVTAVGGGGDIEMSSVSYADGDVARVDSLTYAAPL